MLDEKLFLYGSNGMSGLDFVALLGDRLKAPLLLVINTINEKASADEVPRFLHQLGKRSLNTIINRGKNSRSELRY